MWLFKLEGRTGWRFHKLSNHTSNSTGILLDKAAWTEGAESRPLNFPRRPHLSDVVELPSDQPTAGEEIELVHLS
jgi:hypothetical protein